MLPNYTREPDVKAPAAEKTEYYRFNAKLPMICKDYLQEIAWRNRTTITEYLTRIIMADMEAHPEWEETIDILNDKTDRPMEHRKYTKYIIAEAVADALERAEKNAE